jgi:hypothetical protein
MYFPTHLEQYVTTSHLTWPWLQKVLTSCRRMARKLSCMRAKDVQVPPPTSEARQTRSSQRTVIERLESSRARCWDDEDDDDGDDDDINDPTYDQDELTSSQLVDAPQGTQTQVRVCWYRGTSTLYTHYRLKPNAVCVLKN